MTHSVSYSDDWEGTDWIKLQKVLFRLQRRIFKAIREGDKARAKRLAFANLLLLCSQNASNSTSNPAKPGQENSRN